MQVVAPNVPGMSTRHGRILVLHTCLGECFTGAYAVTISDVFLTTHIELIQLEVLVHFSSMFLQAPT